MSSRGFVDLFSASSFSGAKPRLVIIASLVLLATLANGPARVRPVFMVNGQVYPAEPFSAGDATLVSCGQLTLNLREQRSVYDFQSRDQSLWLGDKCIAWTDAPPDGADVADAWGVLLKDPVEIPEFHPETVLAVSSVDKTRPSVLPKGLRYLSVRGSAGERLVAGQDDLRFLEFEGEHLDLSTLSSPHLSAVVLALERISNPGRLGKLSELKYLSLSVESFRDTSQLSGCLGLETLKLDLSAVSDLRPLASLPNLRNVSAAACPVTELPGEVPWTHLDLLDSQVPRGLVDDFRDANPNCEVWSARKDPLHYQLQSATRVRVRSGGTCHLDGDSLETLYESEELDGLLQHLEFEEVGEELLMYRDSKDVFPGPMTRQRLSSLQECMCCGGPTLEFYGGDRLLATLGNQHGENLRWVGGPWIGDAQLTPSAREFYLNWLNERGVDGPLREVRRSEAQEREIDRKKARAARGFPPELIEYGGVCLFLDEKLREHVREPKERLRLHLQVLGASNEGWVSWSGSDSAPKAADYSPELLRQEVYRWLHSDDPQMVRGAARFVYCAEKFKWVSWTAEELKVARPFMIQGRLTSFVGVRLRALEALDNQWADLEEGTRARLLWMGLEDPSPVIRARACQIVGRVRFQEAATYLRELMAGKPRIRKVPFDLEMDQYDTPDLELDDRAESRAALARLRGT